MRRIHSQIQSETVSKYIYSYPFTSKAAGHYLKGAVYTLSLLPPPPPPTVGLEVNSVPSRHASTKYLPYQSTQLASGCCISSTIVPHSTTGGDGEMGERGVGGGEGREAGRE